MSNVINFSAREFRFDKTCEDNTGIRAVITTSQGNTEAYEIGDWSWSWTQIFCDKKLEKNTDYIFRFAMTGGHNDTDDEVSLAEIYALDGYDDPTSAWEDRMTFALGKSRYAPVISKRDRTGLLRVFEIPFNTGDSENWRFVLIAQHAVAAFLLLLKIPLMTDLRTLPMSSGVRSVQHSLGMKSQSGISRPRISIRLRISMISYLILKRRQTLPQR